MGSSQFDRRVYHLSPGLFSGLVRGVEKETLRVDAHGHVALDSHPQALGSALTHSSITTDFAESLLELITPPLESWQATQQSLHELHAFGYRHLPDGQFLWPGSMPPVLQALADIPIGYYGSSNLGHMKSIYRQGLVHRYGKAMQMIAGLHYNLSFPMAFWQEWLGASVSQANISDSYMNLIRHFHKHYWILPYLFGASPVAMATSVQKKSPPDYLKQLDDGNWMGPEATSLRTSDLGYHNAGQTQLDIRYDSIESYSTSLLAATRRRDSHFAAMGIKRGSDYIQLNDSALQIENEYYAPIRPKQPNVFPERPASALLNRGIAYVEVRVLDLDPFAPSGIQDATAYFMDVFLFFCLQQPEQALPLEKCQGCKQRFYEVVTRGRNPNLMLTFEDQKISFKQAAGELLESLMVLAKIMDQGLVQPVYEAAVQAQAKKLVDVTLTPSHRLLDMIQVQGYERLMLQLAQQYQNFYRDYPLSALTLAQMEQEARTSWERIREIEAQDQAPFDEFLKEYFKY